jgi:hypothetical protein
VDFFSPEAIAARVDEALADQDRSHAMRAKARQTVLRDYDLRTVCLPAQVALISRLAGTLPGPAGVKDALQPA